MKRSLLVLICLLVIAFSLFSTLRSCRRVPVPQNDHVLAGLGAGVAMVANSLATPDDEVVLVSWQFENIPFHRYFQTQEQVCLRALRKGPAASVTLEPLIPFQPDALQGSVLEDHDLKDLLARYPAATVLVSLVGPPVEQNGVLARLAPEARPQIICLMDSAGLARHLLDRGLIAAAVVPREGVRYQHPDRNTDLREWFESQFETLVR